MAQTHGHDDFFYRAKLTAMFINKYKESLDMELHILEESSHKLSFQLKGETHTFCNALKNELHKVKGVQIVTYRIDHALVGVPKFLLETKGIEPRKALKEALESLKKKVKEFQKEVANLWLHYGPFQK